MMPLELIKSQGDFSLNIFRCPSILNFETREHLFGFRREDRCRYGCGPPWPWWSSWYIVRWIADDVDGRLVRTGPWHL